MGKRSRKSQNSTSIDSDADEVQEWINKVSTKKGIKRGPYKKKYKNEAEAKKAKAASQKKWRLG